MLSSGDLYEKILSGIIIAIMMAFGQSVLAKTVPVEAMTSFQHPIPLIL